MNLPLDEKGYKVLVKVVASKQQGSLISRSYGFAEPLPTKPEDIQELYEEIESNIERNGGYEKADQEVLVQAA